jgi:Flp pilus assembly protein TadB
MGWMMLFALFVGLILASFVVVLFLTIGTVALIGAAVLGLILLPGFIVGWRKERKAEHSKPSRVSDPLG